VDNSNRCPECGGTASYLLTDVPGRRLYQCNTGLTTFKIAGEEVKRGAIISCDTTIDEQGKKFTGTVAYASDGKTRTLAFTDGKERR